MMDTDERRAHLDLSTPCIRASKVNKLGRPTTRAEHYRTAWIETFGPIPEGFDIDHECHNQSDCPGGDTCPHRACRNVKHLVLATRKDNLARGRSYSPETNERRGTNWSRRYAAESDEYKTAYAETARQGAVKGWATTDRSPVSCECGSGPFKGPRGLTAHRKQRHT